MPLATTQDAGQPKKPIMQMGLEALAAQPFSQLLGAELTAMSPGSAELVVPIRPELMQQHGFVHGGVISYAADNALTAAGGSALGPAVVTSEYKINYLRPARGERLVARARVIQAGKRQAVCACEVWAVSGQDEVLCAVAQGTIVTLPAAPG
jgi:uncharacterized protein (TIGR00369 family)